MAWGAFKKEAASEPERWSVSCILYVCQPLQGLLFCAYKEKILPLVRLIDKIVQGLAGIVGKIPENSRFHMIIDKLLQNFPCKPSAEDKEILAYKALVQHQPGSARLVFNRHGQIQGGLRVCNHRDIAGNNRYIFPVFLYICNIQESFISFYQPWGTGSGWKGSILYKREIVKPAPGKRGTKAAGCQGLVFRGDLVPVRNDEQTVN